MAALKSPLAQRFGNEFTMISLIRFLDGLLLALGLGFGRVVAFGCLFRQSQCAQMGRALSYRRVRRRDLSHGFDAIGVLRELSLQPDLFQFGSALRFVVHPIPLI